MPGWTSLARFLLLLLIFLPGTSRGDDAVRLVPASSAVAEGVAVSPSPSLGTSWADVNVARLVTRSAGRQVRLPVADGPEPMVWLPSRTECSLLIADLGPGADRRRADAWRRVTHATKILRCPDTGRAEARGNARRRAGALATAKVGSRVEVRPLLNPATVRPGRDLAVRVYREGSAQADVAIAIEGPDGATATVRTDGSGIATVRVASAGQWRIRYRTTLDGRAAQATFSFDVPPASLWAATRPEGV